MESTSTILTELISAATTGMGLRILSLLTDIAIGVAVGLLGLLLARSISKLVEKVLKDANYKKIVELVGIDEGYVNTQIKDAIVRLISTVVYWNVLLVDLFIMGNVLNNETISNFAAQLLEILVNIIWSAGLLLAGSIVINFVAEIIVANTTAIKGSQKGVLEFVLKFTLYGFIVATSLYQLNIARPVVLIMFGAISLLAIMIYWGEKK